MKFRIRQTFDGTPQEVMRAYADPNFYPYLQNLTKVGQPQVVDRRDEGGQALLWVRYKFIAPLPGAARKFIDPNRLTWVEASRFDLAAGIVYSQLNPDHYPDKLAAQATATFTSDAGPQGRTTRTIDGELVVKGIPLLGGKVEHAIVGGLREHMVEEQPIAQWWIDYLRTLPEPESGAAPEAAPAASYDSASDSGYGAPVAEPDPAAQWQQPPPDPQGGPGAPVSPVW
jgi:hypothetical protein